MSSVLCTLHMYYMYRSLNFITIEHLASRVFITLLASLAVYRKEVVVNLETFSASMFS